MPPYKIIEYSTLIILLFLIVNTVFIIFIKKILDIKKIEVYKGVESEVKMTEEIIKETKIRLEVLKEALELVNQYKTQECIEAALLGKIEANQMFLECVEK